MRSQIISTDLMIAIIIIMFIIASLSSIIYIYTEQSIKQERDRDINLKAQSAINSLLETGGSPSNWEEQTIT